MHECTQIRAIGFRLTFNRTILAYGYSSKSFRRHEHTKVVLSWNKQAIKRFNVFGRLENIRDDLFGPRDGEFGWFSTYGVALDTFFLFFVGLGDLQVNHIESTRIHPNSKVLSTAASSFLSQPGQEASLAIPAGRPQAGGRWLRLMFLSYFLWDFSRYCKASPDGFLRDF